MAKSRYKFFEPDRLMKFQNLNLLVRQAVEGFISGLHRSPHRGFSVEFSEHREYVSGDDLRHLDWTAWARSDRLYLKQYEQETNLRSYILLDVSGSMNYCHSGKTSKFSYGCFLAGCLAYLMARQQDMVGMITFDQKVRMHISPGSTPVHLDRIFKHLEEVQPGGLTAIAPTFDELAETIPRRALVIVISDLYDDQAAILKALQHFVYKKHQIIVIHLMDPAELELPFKNTVTFVDSETGQKIQVDPRMIRTAYQKELGDFIGRYRRECSDRDIEYVTATTDIDYDQMLLKYLASRRAIVK